MKILLINERYNSGGTEVQTLREKKAFEEMGHEVYLITFDPKQKDKRNLDDNDHWVNIPVKFNVFQTLVNHVLGSKKYRTIIGEYIKDIKPDFIHINNVFAFPDDVYSCVRSIPTMQTIRDYMSICPLGTCIDERGIQCKGYLYGNCYRCVKYKPRYVAKRLLMPRLNSRRKNAVNYIVSPSQALANACRENNLPVSCLNNPFDFSILKKTDSCYESDIYMYYGKIAAIKGIKELIQAFKEIHILYPQKKLWIFGGIDDDYVNTFYSLINNCSDFIEYKGVVSNSEIMEIYKDIYCVIVPSLWIENYPNTVLEAIANKTLVIGSNRGGIPELIGNEDLLFNILDKKDVVRVIEHTVNITKEDYISIIEAAYNRICDNNTIEKYAHKVMRIYDTIIEESHNV